MSYLPTLTLITAVKTYLAALKLTDAVDAPPLANVVEFYGSDNIGLALNDLIIVEDRVALVVPAGDDFEGEPKGGLLVSRMTSGVDVILADRVFSEAPQQGNFGSADNPGVVAMKDRVLAKLVGQGFGLRGVSLVPVESGALQVPIKDKDGPGRQVWIISFETRAGDARASIPP